MSGLAAILIELDLVVCGQCLLCGLLKQLAHGDIGLDCLRIGLDGGNKSVIGFFRLLLRGVACWKSTRPNRCSPRRS